MRRIKAKKICDQIVKVKPDFARAMADFDMNTMFKNAPVKHSSIFKQKAFYIPAATIMALGIAASGIVIGQGIGELSRGLSGMTICNTYDSFENMAETMQRLTQCGNADLFSVFDLQIAGVSDYAYRICGGVDLNLSGPLNFEEVAQNCLPVLDGRFDSDSYFSLHYGKAVSFDAAQLSWEVLSNSSQNHVIYQLRDEEHKEILEVWFYNIDSDLCDNICHSILDVLADLT